MDPAKARRSVARSILQLSRLGREPILRRTFSHQCIIFFPAWLATLLFYCHTIPQALLLLFNIPCLPFFDQVAGPTYTVYVIRIFVGAL